MEPHEAADRLPVALSGHGGYLAVRLGNRARRLFEAAIAELDLRTTDYDLLATVAEFGPISQRDIAQSLGVDAARMVAAVDALEQRRIVARTVDPGDRRRNLIRITAEGTALLRQARAVATRVEDELLTPLSADQRETLRELIRLTLDIT